MRIGTQHQVSLNGRNNTLVFYPLPPQAPILLLNQNKTLNLVPLWVFRESLADGHVGVDVP